MNEHDQIRLMEYLDGRLPADEAAAVEDWLRSDADARRLADEHRRAWDLLGELESPVEAEGSPDFRQDILERARREGGSRRAPGRRRALALVAAALMVAVGLFALRDESPSWARLTAEERDIIQNLDLLESLDLLERYGSQLDLAVDIEVMRAFDGELVEASR